MLNSEHRAYSIAYTHVVELDQLARKYGFELYKKQLNTYVHLWIIELPEEAYVYTHTLFRTVNSYYIKYLCIYYVTAGPRISMLRPVFVCLEYDNLHLSWFCTCGSNRIVFVSFRGCY